MSARTKRYRQSGGGSGLVTQLLNAYLSQDSEFSENPDFEKQPGEVDYTYKGDPNELVTKKYLDKGGRVYGTKYGKELESARLASRDAAEIEVNKQKQLGQAAKELEDTIRVEKERREGELLTQGYRALTERKPLTVTEGTPIESNKPLLQGVDLPSMYNDAYAGQIYKRIYGDKPLMEAISGGESIQAKNLYDRDKTNLDSIILGQNRENALTTARNTSAAAVADSRIPLDETYRKNKQEVANELLLKQLDRLVGDRDTIFGHGGRRFQGATPRQISTPTLTYRDPKTGQAYYGDPKVTTTYDAGQELPAVNNLELDAFLNRQQGVSPYSDNKPITIDPSAAFNIDEVLRKQKELERLRKLFAPLRGY